MYHMHHFKRRFVWPTWDKPPLDQGDPVAWSHQLELDPAEGGALAVELSRDGALWPRAFRKLKSSPGGKTISVEQSQQPYKVSWLTWCCQYHWHRRMTTPPCWCCPATPPWAHWPCPWPPRPPALIMSHFGEPLSWKDVTWSLFVKCSSELTWPWSVGCTCSLSSGQCASPRTSSRTWYGRDRSLRRPKELFDILRCQYWSRKPENEDDTCVMCKVISWLTLLLMLPEDSFWTVWQEALVNYSCWTQTPRQSLYRRSSPWWWAACWGEQTLAGRHSGSWTGGGRGRG